MALIVTKLKSLVTLTDTTDATKQSTFNVNSVATGTNHAFYICDNDIMLGDPFGKIQIGLGSGINGVYGIGIGAETGTPDNGYGISIGYRAGYHNTQATTGGSYNTAVGANAMKHSNSGGANTAIGSGAMHGDAVAYISGSFNTAVGADSLISLTSGNYNSCFGLYAGDSITSGISNVCLGDSSDVAAAGQGNVVIGSNAQSTGGNNQVVIGRDAQTTGAKGIAIGYSAIGANTSVAIGDAATNVTFINSVALGKNATNIDDNDIVLGNATTATLRCQVGLSALSDVHFKTNISSLPEGLDMIDQLRPVEFTFTNDEANKRHVGLIAQEVDAIDSRYVLKTDPNQLMLTYSDFIPVLINAVKELSARVTTLEQS